MCVYIHMHDKFSSPHPQKGTTSAAARLQADLHRVAHLFPQGPFLALLQAPRAQGQGRILRDQGGLQLLQRLPGDRWETQA